MLQGFYASISIEDNSFTGLLWIVPKREPRSQSQHVVVPITHRIRVVRMKRFHCKCVKHNLLKSVNFVLKEIPMQCYGAILLEY